jgi:hypothetical protein
MKSQMSFVPLPTRFVGNLRNNRTATLDVIVFEITLEVFSSVRRLMVRGAIPHEGCSLVDSI